MASAFLTPTTICREKSANASTEPDLNILSERGLVTFTRAGSEQ